MSIWSLAGILLAVALAGAAWNRSRGSGGFYDESVYGMTGATHRRYAVAGGAFAILFAAIALTHSDAILIPTYAAFVLLVVFYGTSFLRGFSDDDV